MWRIGSMEAKMNNYNTWIKYQDEIELKNAEIKIFEFETKKKRFTK